LSRIVQHFEICV